MQKRVIVFLKFPEEGRVKTRLGKVLGHAEAVRIYRMLAGRVFAVVCEVEGASVQVLFDPPERAAEVKDWLEEMAGGKSDEIELRAQAPGDLGVRMEAAFAQAFAEGMEMVAAIGTDCVGLSAETFEAAWNLLEERDVVLGPTLDGGYYLLGIKELRQEIFRGVPWSSEDTLAATLRAAERAGLSIGLLKSERDVDDIADWEAVKEGFGG